MPSPQRKLKFWLGLWKTSTGNEGYSLIETLAAMTAGLMVLGAACVFFFTAGQSLKNLEHRHGEWYRNQVFFRELEDCVAVLQIPPWFEVEAWMHRETDAAAWSYPVELGFPTCFHPQGFKVKVWTDAKEIGFEVGSKSSRILLPNAELELIQNGRDYQNHGKTNNGITGIRILAGSLRREFLFGGSQP